jgi:hypothetical protein
MKLCLRRRESLFTDRNFDSQGQQKKEKRNREGVSKEAVRLVEFGVGKEALAKKNKVQRESTGFG